MLDHGLQTLLSRGFSAQAIDFVSAYLSKHVDQIEIGSFDSFSQSLVSGPPVVLNHVMVRWLLSGEHALCDGLAAQIRKHGRGEQPFDIEMEEFGLSDSQIYFVCRKAIGYFFTQPIVAGSVLVSALRTATPKLAEALQELLFDPLLISYSGVLRDHLGTLASPDRAAVRIQEVLQRCDAYLQGLRSIEDIKELHPSEHHRELVRVQWNDQMQEAAKEAEKQSVFRSIVKTSVLLYGHRSVSFVENAGGKRRAVEMELKSHSFSFEFPRREIVDPIGLAESLLRFRSERLRK